MNKKNLLVLSFATLAAISLVGCGNDGATSISSQDISSIETTSESGEYIYTGLAYRVYFYADNGSDATLVRVASGNTVARPSDPTNGIKKFLGWYTTRTRAEGTEYDFSKPVRSNLILYAKWEDVSSEEVEAYNAEWEAKSEANHLYIHYKRVNDDYDDWDVWSWPYNGDGYAFDFVKDSSSKIVYDELGGAYVDIDLTQTYSPAGWLDGAPVSSLTMSYMNDGSLVSKVGFQIVKKSTRSNADAYWTNDGDDNFVTMSEARWDNGSYHVFAVENNVPNFTTKYSADQAENPYENDDGNNVSEANVSSSAAGYSVSATASDFYQNSGVGYQIMVASFADSDGDGMGDIYGITQKLQYLKDNLHINSLWLTPVQLSDSYHAYDIIDYTKVDPKFGSTASPNSKGTAPTEESAMKDYEDLLAKAEELDIRVMMDLVINHTSKKNTWFLKSSNLDEEYRSYYQWKKLTDTVTEYDANGKASSVTTEESENWHRFSSTPYAYYGKFASSMPELNYDYQGTRDAMVNVGKFWLDKGVDGFRIDAVKHIYMADEVTAETNDETVKDYDKATSTDYSSNLTKNLNFFREFNARLKEYNPNAMIVGENFDGNAVNNVSRYYEGLDSLFDFYTYYKLSNIAMSDSGQSSNSGARAQSIAISSSSNDWNIPGITKTYAKYRKEAAIDSPFTSNHDLPRVMNMMVGTVKSADDQTAGTVTSSNASKAIERAKVYAAVQLMLPGTTWIYYGDELGMSSNYGDDETSTSAHVDRWYRQPYKFDADGSMQTGFSFTGGAGFKIELDSYNSTIKSAAEQLTDSSSMLSVYKELTAIKSSIGGNNSYTGISTGKETVFAFTRTAKDGTKYNVYANFGSSATSVSTSGTPYYSINSASSSSLPGHSVLITKA